MYTDIRNLLSFVKENHGGTFRKIAFAALLEPLVKLKQENQQRLLRLGQIDQKLVELKQLRESFVKINESSDSNIGKKGKSVDLEEDNSEDLVNNIENNDQQDEEENSDNDDAKSTSTNQKSLSQLQINLNNDTTSYTGSKQKMSIDFSNMNAETKESDNLSPSEKNFPVKRIADLKKAKKKPQSTINYSPTTFKKKSEKDKINNRSSNSINEANVDTISLSSSHFLSVIQSTFNLDPNNNNNKESQSGSVSNASSLLQIETNEGGTSLKRRLLQKHTSNLNSLKETLSKVNKNHQASKQRGISVSSSKSSIKEGNNLSFCFFFNWNN